MDERVVSLRVGRIHRVGPWNFWAAAGATSACRAPVRPIAARGAALPFFCMHQSAGSPAFVAPKGQTSSSEAAFLDVGGGRSRNVSGRCDAGRRG